MRKWVIAVFVFISLNLISINVELINNHVEISGDFNLIELQTKSVKTNFFDTVKIEECVNTGKAGEAELAVYSKLIALPETGNFKISNIHYDYEEIDLQNPLLFVGWQEDISKSDSFYQQNDWFPKDIVTISDPNLMRSYRFAQVTVAAAQYNPALNKLRVIKNLQLGLDLDDSITKNPLTKIHPSKAFDKLASQKILGARSHRTMNNGQYLFIAPDAQEQTLQPLLREKEKLGYKTKLALLSETGSTNNQIKNYIQNAYDNWDNPPEFVVLVGDVGGAISVPAFFVDGYLLPTCVTDHTYTLLDGNDYFPDVFIGRLSVRSEFELNTIISKIINYEFNPYIETDWMTKAVMVSYVQDNYWHFFSPRETVMAVREKLLDFEYTAVDTFIAPWNSGSSNLRNMINGGYSFVNYRGCGAPEYWAGPYGSMFDINDITQLNNGSLLPFVTSITCGGGDFAYAGLNSVFGETWLNSGTPSFPKGAIGFIGPSEHDTKTWFNNANDMGIYQGITQEGLFRGGEMLLRGKMELFNNFPFSHAWGNSLNSDQFYFYVYNLLGDPGLQVMTQLPQNIEFTFPTELNTYANFIPVNITNPVFDAADFTIAITNSDSLIACGITESDGKVNIPLNNLPAGTYEITASRYGYIPKTYSFEVVQQDIIGVTNILFTEAMAGSTVEFSFDLENNTGNEETVNIVLSSDNDNVTFDNYNFNYQISAGSSLTVDSQFNLSETWLDSKPIEINLELSYSNYTDNYLLLTSEQSPLMSFSDITVANIEECLLQNQENTVYLELFNCGSLPASPFQVELISLNANAIITQANSTYPAINTSDDAWSQEAFLVECGNVMSGELAKFQLNIFTNSELVQELIFSVPIGVITEDSPTFCDYGYAAIESEDEGNFNPPQYDWIDIDPVNGGGGTLINPVHTTSDGSIAIVNLPFTFRYFGEEYDIISICTNGYISMGETETIFHRNRMIPSGVGSRAMIAPFWDDLSSGNVYYKFFPAENYFIIQWDNMRNVYNYSYETFQVILYDPDFYPTDTGDGQIKFQYDTVHNVDQNDHYATVGIENYSQTEGIQITFANIYANTAHTLQDETAILFTTNLSPQVDSEEPLLPPISNLHNYPNPFNPSTTFSFAVSQPTTSLCLTVYNLKGQKVKTFEIQDTEAASINVEWNGNDENNQPVASGIYFYKLSDNKKVLASQKCLLLK